MSILSTPEPTLVTCERTYWHAGKPRVTSTDTCTADNIGTLQQVTLALLLQRTISLLIRHRQLSRLVFQLLQFLQLGRAGRAADLLVQREKRNWRVDGFATLGTQADHAKTGTVDLCTVQT